MIPLSFAVSSGLTWSKISRSCNYQLELDGEVAGTLERSSFWRSEFVAETEAGRWIFRRGGFLGTGAEIVDAASRQPVAAFKSSWGAGGTLTFADGEKFRLECSGWWHPMWSVSTEGGQPVLLLYTREKTVETTGSAAVAESRLSLLVMFAWYRVLRAEEDAASAATVVIATS